TCYTRYIEINVVARPMSRRKETTMKTKTPTTPKVEYSPIAMKAFGAAMELNSARREYARVIAEIEQRIARIPTEFERTRSSYAARGEMVQDAQNIVSFIQSLNENFRIDLV